MKINTSKQKFRIPSCLQLSCITHVLCEEKYKDDHVKKQYAICFMNVNISFIQITCRCLMFQI